MATRGLRRDEEASFRRRRKPEGELDLTPMIDVTFLLLIFFMVSSTMQSTPDLDLPVAAQSVGVDSAGAVVVTILAGVQGNDPRILLGDGAGDEGDLEDVKDYVAVAVASGKTRVVVKAEGDVPHQTVEAVSRVVADVNGAELFLGVGEGPES